jgi:hypothetical protein
MTDDLLVKFARRLRVTDRFAELVYATGNYYAKQRMKLSDAECRQRLKAAGAEVERLCIENAIMQDLLQNSSITDRTWETAMERADDLRSRIDAARKDARSEKEQKKTESAAAAIAGQVLLHGDS